MLMFVGVVALLSPVLEKCVVEAYQEDMDVDMHYGCIMDVDMVAILAISFTYFSEFVLRGGSWLPGNGPIWLFYDLVKIFHTIRINYHQF